jgi:hypothetical protein
MFKNAFLKDFVWHHIHDSMPHDFEDVIVHCEDDDRFHICRYSRSNGWYYNEENVDSFFGSIDYWGYVKWLRKSLPCNKE